MKAFALAIGILASMTAGAIFPERESSSLFVTTGYAGINPDMDGRFTEFGYRQHTRHFTWEAALGLSSSSLEGTALPGSFDSIRVLEPLPLNPHDPERFYSFFSAYSVALRLGRSLRLGPVSMRLMAGLLPHMVSHVYADTAYIPSESEPGRSVFMSEYYGNRYFGLGADVWSGIEYHWRGWTAGAVGGYTRWARHSGISFGISIGRSLGIPGDGK